MIDTLLITFTNGEQYTVAVSDMLNSMAATATLGQLESGQVTLQGEGIEPLEQLLNKNRDTLSLVAKHEPTLIAFVRKLGWERIAEYAERVEIDYAADFENATFTTVTRQQEAG